MKIESKNCNNCGDINCAAHGDGEQFSCKNWERKHYRPFKNTDELIEEWDKKLNYRDPTGLAMPYIWVRYKKEDGSKSKGHLIHGFYEDIIEIQDRTMSMKDLFYFCEFLNGSPCGVEE